MNMQLQHEMKDKDGCESTRSFNFLVYTMSFTFLADCIDVCARFNYRRDRNEYTMILTKNNAERGARSGLNAS